MNDMTRMDTVSERPARFTVAEFMELVTTEPIASMVGKLELVDGVMVHMAPAHMPHFGYQRQMFRELDAIFGDGIDGWIVGQEPTVRFDNRNTREPDVCIMRFPKAGETLLPGDHVLLAVEISDSSIKIDLGPKRKSYARFGVPHYWVVDIKGRKTHCMTALVDGDYAERLVVPFGQALAVPGMDQTIIVT
jgi:Uma2 family endonuclease